MVTLFDARSSVKACQGDKLDEGNDVTDAEVFVEDTKKPTLPREADFLYAYSTAPGDYQTCFELLPKCN